jgi:regulatory protein
LSPGATRPLRNARPASQNESSSEAASTIFSRALRLLALRSYSEAGLRKRLADVTKSEPGIVDDCISRLEKLGYLDDHKFALGYAGHRIGARPVGRSRLARELANKRVDRRIIDKALDAVYEQNSEETLIERAIEKRLRSVGPPRTRKDLKRMADHLVRLGFAYDLIRRRLRGLTTSEFDLDENESR